MAIFENFPYTNFHELNLDYILKRVKELEGEVADLTALLESGPVVDVKANVNGSWVSQKDASGNVNLPAGNHNTIGGLKYESTADTEEPFIALNNGSGWEKVPALDASDKIDPSLYDVPVQDAKTFDTSEGDWVSIMDGVVAKLPAATQTKAGTIMYSTKSDLSAPYGHLTSGTGDDYLPVLDANKQVDASVIPDTTVTAGTYGTSPALGEGTHNYVYGLAVGSDGRLIAVHSDTELVMRKYTLTIPSGTYGGSVYFNVNAAPWYDTNYFVNVAVYESLVDGMGNTYLQELVHGTDYTTALYKSGYSEYVSIVLPATKSNTCYAMVNGAFGLTNK